MVAPTKTDTIAMRRALHAGAIGAALCLTLFALAVPLMFHIMDELARDWAEKFAEIRAGNYKAWTVILSHYSDYGKRVRRSANRYQIVSSGYLNNFYDSNSSNRQQTKYYTSHKSLAEYGNEKPAINKAEYDGLAATPPMYSTANGPEFGYGFAKLRCCCSLKNYQSSEALIVSYKCPRGLQGPPGLAGEPGSSGGDGRRGVDGLNYSTFASLFDPNTILPDINRYGDVPNVSSQRDCGSCPLGPPGAPGAPGKVGPRGPSGVPGKHGIPGLPGRSGMPGVMGEFGAVGLAGHPGAIGPKGLDGLKGSKGSPGTKGTSGSIGAQGSRGSAGPNGSAGTVGARGEPGPQGIKGQRGMDGADGEAGLRGAPGKDALYCKCPSRSASASHGSQYSQSQSSYSLSTSLPQFDYASKTQAEDSPKETYTTERKIYKKVTKKYFVENTHPPSAQPQMPSSQYAGAYSSDSNPLHYYVPLIYNQSRNQLTYNIQSQKPIVTVTQNRAYKAAEANAPLRADAYAFTYAPVYHATVAPPVRIERTTTLTHVGVYRDGHANSGYDNGRVIGRYAAPPPSLADSQSQANPPSAYRSANSRLFYDPDQIAEDAIAASRNGRALSNVRDQESQEFQGEAQPFDFTSEWQLRKNAKQRISKIAR